MYKLWLNLRRMCIFVRKPVYYLVPGTGKEVTTIYQLQLAGGTRTCLYNLSEHLSAEEMTKEKVDAALDGATLAYFDGFLAEAALVVARAARSKGIQVWPHHCLA